MPAPAIVDLQAEDIAQLERLLEANGLPSADCGAENLHFIGIIDTSGLIAAGGLEAAGDYGLLRSVVVDRSHRGSGLAAAITRDLLRRARERGYAAIFLLTESAEKYFARFGFEPVARAAVPHGITRTRQFASLCPDDAVCMRLPLAAK